jgi:hypothetical protein
MQKLPRSPGPCAITWSLRLFTRVTLASWGPQSHYYKSSLVSSTFSFIFAFLFLSFAYQLFLPSWYVLLRLITLDCILSTFRSLRRHHPVKQWKDPQGHELDHPTLTAHTRSIWTTASRSKRTISQAGDGWYVHWTRLWRSFLLWVGPTSGCGIGSINHPPGWWYHPALLHVCPKKEACKRAVWYSLVFSISQINPQ